MLVVDWKGRNQHSQIWTVRGATARWSDVWNLPLPSWHWATQRQWPSLPIEHSYPTEPEFLSSIISQKTWTTGLSKMWVLESTKRPGSHSSLSPQIECVCICRFHNQKHAGRRMQSYIRKMNVERPGQIRGFSRSISSGRADWQKHRRFSYWSVQRRFFQGSPT